MAAPTEFRTRVLSVVCRIPPGQVATYGDVAEAAGRPRAWRAVGNIMRTCTAAGVPCHRVIAAAGQLGGYGGNLEMKRALLRAEGLLVSLSRVRDFNARRWHLRARRRQFPSCSEVRRREPVRAIAKIANVTSPRLDGSPRSQRR